MACDKDSSRVLWDFESLSEDSVDLPPPYPPGLPTPAAAADLRSQQKGRKGMSYFERLSAQDSSFIRFDAGRGQLNLGALARFKAPEPGGSPPDIHTVRAHVAARLHLLPHYRQRIAQTPLQRHPIWVDDDRFDLSHHVRLCALPQPGGTAELKELAGTIASQPLDLSRPLWELWLVEGLADGGCAVIAKVHHCLADGVTGVGVLQTLLSPDAADDGAIPPAEAWEPRPMPGPGDFLADGLDRMMTRSRVALRNARWALEHPLELLQETARASAAGVDTLAGGLTPPPDTALNGDIGRQRRIEWVDLDLSAVKDVKKRLDGTVNDVVLSVVAGAARRFLAGRSADAKDLELRAIVPVDMRAGKPEETAGNMVSSWFVDLPTSNEQPLERFQKIREQTRQRKNSQAETGVDFFLRFADWSGSSRLTFWGASLVQRLRPYNLIVTNVHGPPVPLYLLGSRLEAFYPVVPLFEGQGLSIAAMSYQNRICYGIEADRDLVPDIAAFAEAITEAFEELRQVAMRPDPPQSPELRATRTPSGPANYPLGRPPARPSPANPG